jgi:hypothetical protein
VSAQTKPGEVIDLAEWQRRRVAAWDARHPGTELPPMTRLPLPRLRDRRANEAPKAQEGETR